MLALAPVIRMTLDMLVGLKEWEVELTMHDGSDFKSYRNSERSTHIGTEI